MGRAWDEDLAAVVEGAGADVLADLSPSYTMHFSSPDELWQVSASLMTPSEAYPVDDIGSLVRFKLWSFRE